LKSGTAEFKIREDSDDEQPQVADDLQAMDRTGDAVAGKKFQA
jgi:hypothetical protein